MAQLSPQERQIIHDSLVMTAALAELASLVASHNAQAQRWFSEDRDPGPDLDQLLAEGQRLSQAAHAAAEGAKATPAAAEETAQAPEAGPPPSAPADASGGAENSG